MFVFIRCVEESLIIEGGIRIVVLGVKGNQVRFGIDAPRDIPVHRMEIYDRIQRERQDSPRARSIDGFFGQLSGKTPKVASLEELQETTADGWAGLHEEQE